MSATNRAKLISKLQAALKKNYSVPPATPSRPLLEHALYACLLEDCPSDLADEGLAKLEQDYFDWNEVRVTTVTELAGVLSSLPDSQKAASRLKANLQGIFEEFYTFDLDHLKKENLGKAVGKFEKMPAMTPFVLSYIIQHGLGGHSIPIDYSAMVIMLVTGIASQSEASGGRVPGLERAVPKSKGIEFAALLHQPAVALTMDPKDKKGRALLESVLKGSSADLDEWLVTKKAAKKRVAKRKAAERVVAKQEAEAAAEAAAAADAARRSGAGKKKAPKRSAAKSPPTKRATEAKAAAKAAEAAATEAAAAKSAAAEKAKAKAPVAKDKAASKASTQKSTAKKTGKKTATEKATTKSSKKSSTTKSATAKKPASTKKSAAGKKTTSKKKSATGSSTSKATSKKSTSAKKSSTTSKPATKSKSAKKSSSSAAKSTKSGGTKKSTNRKLTKRKPR